MSKKNQPNKEKLGGLVKEGYDLIPLHQAHAIGPNGKTVGKRPLQSKWTKNDAPPIAETLALMDEGHNVGVKLNQHTLVVDIDPRNFALEGETDKNGNVLPHRPDLALEEKYGFKLNNYPTVLTGSYFPAKDPSTGLHVYMRVNLPEGWEEGDKLSVHLDGYKGIDFKSVGGQVVAPGSVHPDFNRYYEWEDLECPLLSKILDAPAELINDLWKKAPGGSNVIALGEQDMTPDMLQALLDQLVVEEFRDHEQWLQLMMACHAATQGEGMNEFVAWSTSDPMFAHVGSDIAYRWETFNADAKGGLKYGSLKHIAQKHGVTQMPTDTDEFADTQDEDYDPETGENIAKVPEPKVHPLKELNDKFMCVMEGGQFKIYQEEHDLALERLSLVKYQVRDFRMLLADRKIQSGKKTIPLADAWLEWPGRNFFNSVQFLPEYGDERIINEGGRRIFNTWRGFAVTAKEEGSCSLLYELIHDVLADQDKVVEQYLLNWLAFAVQYPWKAAEVAMVFRGGKGTGKSTLGRTFFKLFNPHGLHITSSTLLTGRFNQHLRDMVALFADEAFFAGDKAGEQTLKGLVTEPMITFEGKGTNAEMGRNCLHIMMASNSQWVVPAGSEGERRFAVFDVNDSRKEDAKFFGALHKQLDDGGMEKLLYDLLNRDIKGWHPRAAIPKTKALLEQMQEGYTPLEHFIFEALVSGDCSSWVPFENEWYLDGGCMSLKACFIDAFSLYVKQSGNRLWLRDLTPTSIGRQLRKIFGDDLDDKKLSAIPEGFDYIATDRPAAWIFPSLDRCRAIWDARQGANIDWDGLA